MSDQFDEPTKSLAQSVPRCAALKRFGLGLAGLALALVGFELATVAEGVADSAPAKTPATVPWSQLGAKAGADYKGDGLAVVASAEGACLHCVFQRLEGEATPEGLWLTSTVTNGLKDRFRVVAVAVRRQSSSSSSSTLEKAGTVSLDGQTVRFIRPGLIEEYTVNMDGVRQDFLLPERPHGAGELVISLVVSGANIEPAPSGTRLALENSGRKIAYTRLRATDANGRELLSRMEVTSPTTLAAVVDDIEAVYPVRIDPTFSDANWISMGSIPGANGEVRALAIDASGNLYIGGQFTIVGDAFATNIAKWNGSHWSALGPGMQNDPFGFREVYALAVMGNDLYAGGEFTIPGGSPATNIAKWDGNTWSPLGSGLTIGNDTVRALAVSGSDLYVGGHFDSAGGIAAANIAKWNGTSWSALGAGIGGGYGYVNALAVSGSDLYAGGSFTTAGGSPANRIAKWNGNTWSALGSGMDLFVYALAVYGSSLYAGGQFTTAGGSAANCIAKWNGSNWSALGSGMVGDYYGHPQVNALAVSGSNVYAGGYFTNAGGSTANCIAKWNGSSWSALDFGMGTGGDAYWYPNVYALSVSGSNVYAGGIFITAGKGGATYIAKLQGSSWSALGSGVNGEVEALAVSGSDLYAGGYFTTASGASAVAKWNGSSWTTLGSGIPITSPSSPVLALATSGSDLYAGGSFTNAGGVAASNIVKWNGSTWSALGSGINGDVYALAVSGSNLYAGGSFTTAGGSTANCIAKWNGSSWSGLGWMGGYVLTLAVSGSDLYAGGGFTFTNAGSAFNFIAKWDGSTWSGLGGGMDYLVRALAVSGSNLYAGGQFTMAGGAPASYIAKWDGASWSALGSGLSAPAGDPYYGVYSLAVSGGDLYAGGEFTVAGGIAATNIAKWDGSNWSALGSGMGPASPNMPPYVLALAASGSDLYAGGLFTTAGGKASGYIARAYVLPLPSLSVIRFGANVTVSWPSPDTAGFALEQVSTLLPSTWLPSAAHVVDDGTNKSVTIPATNNAQFFRLRAP